MNEERLDFTSLIDYMPIIKIHSTVKVFEIIGILKINYELSIFGTLV